MWTKPFQFRLGRREYNFGEGQTEDITAIRVGLGIWPSGDTHRLTPHTLSLRIKTKGKPESLTHNCLKMLSE